MRVLLIFLLPVVAMAEVVCTLGPGIASYQPSGDQRPSSDAMQIAGRLNAAEKQICGANCPEVGLFRNTTAPHAALIVNPGEAKLVYDPQFFAKVYSSYGDPGLLAIIAHEMGHALDDTMGAAWVNQKWARELRADSWAGCILGKGNLNATEMQAALGALAKNPATGHPAWNVRLPAIRAGYSHCGGSPALVH